MHLRFNYLGRDNFYHRNSTQKSVLPVSFPVDLLLPYSSEFTGKETGKTHLCAVYHVTKPSWNRVNEKVIYNFAKINLL